MKEHIKVRRMSMGNTEGEQHAKTWRLPFRICVETLK